MGAVLTNFQITFNTQGSSQWDSFRHFAYQKEAVFYNGVTQNDVHALGLTNPVNGLGGEFDYKTPSPTPLLTFD
jgi:hypothetical protein